MRQQRNRFWSEGFMCRMLGAFGAGMILSVATSWAAAPVKEVSGEQIYKEHCATCHDTATRAPKFAVMRKLPAVFVLRSLELGKMKFQGIMRTGAERRAVSEYVADKKLPPVAVYAQLTRDRAQGQALSFGLLRGRLLRGWSRERSGATRRIPPPPLRTALGGAE